MRDADIVLPSLDAAVDDAFQKINRPASHPGIERYIQGLIDFRKEFTGKIWLEVFILPEFNDSENNFQELL